MLFILGLLKSIEKLEASGGKCAVQEKTTTLFLDHHLEESSLLVRNNVLDLSNPITYFFLLIILCLLQFLELSSK